MSTARLFEVLDKGKAAAVTVIVETRDKASNDLIFENHSTVFVRGSGGLGGRKIGKGVYTRFLMRVGRCSWSYYVDRGPATAANKPPRRKPDAVMEEKTLLRQGTIYR